MRPTCPGSVHASHVCSCLAASPDSDAPPAGRVHIHFRIRLRTMMMQPEDPQKRMHSAACAPTHAGQARPGDQLPVLRTHALDAGQPHGQGRSLFGHGELSVCSLCPWHGGTVARAAAAPCGGMAAGKGPRAGCHPYSCSLL